MKITMLRNPSRELGCELLEGQTGDVDDALATALINARIAEPATTTEEKKVKGVPKAPEIKGE